MADHDQRMKGALKEFICELQDLTLPLWTGRYDFTEPQWQPQEVFLNPPQGERRILDLVAVVGVTQPLEGANQSVLHVEVEWGDNVADLRTRMPRYHPALVFRYNIPVLSLALYMNVGLEGRGWDEAEENYWGVNLGKTRWASLGLPALDALTYVEGSNLLGVALSVLMRCPEDRKAWLKARALQRLAEAPLTPVRRYLLMEIVEAYLPLVGPHLNEYEQLLLTEDFKMVRELGQTTFEKGVERGMELAQTTFEKGVEKGIEKGILKGEEQGIVKGQRELLRKQLEASFGPLSETAQGRLEAMSLDDLLRLGLALLRADSLAKLGLDGPGNGSTPPAS